MATRRDFLKRSALLSLAPFVPRFLLGASSRVEGSAGDSILVVLQLDGGNDGLNVVVPWRSEEYARLRPSIQVDPARGIQLDDELVLHPSLRPLARRCDDGQIAVIQGVSYPNPNRSHFESMRIWQTALPDAIASESLGWLGLATDPLAQESAALARNVFVGPTQVPLALHGRRTATIALRRIEDLALAAPELAARGSATTAATPPVDDLKCYVQRVACDGCRTARQLAADGPSMRASPAPAANESDLDEQLQTLARLIAFELPARIYYTLQSGYDTHAVQPAIHARLLGELATAVDRFFATLEATGHAARVALLVFSEFGRRVAENAGSGTDHGTAGPVFLIGPGVRGGLHGETPRLDALVDGDLAPTLDFRRIYATVLGDWMRLPEQERLHGQEKLALFR